MRRLVSLAASTILAVNVAFIGRAGADEFADAVDDFQLPDPGCLVAGGTCDVTGDDNDGGVDALDAPDGDVSDNTTFTSLGFDTDLSRGGTLVLDFTDNVCLDDGSAAVDFTIDEVAGVDEDYSVEIGQQGETLTALSVDGLGTTSFDNEGVASFNQVKMTALGNAVTDPTGGADIDAVTCLNSLDFGTAHVVKGDLSPTTINITSKDGFDAQQSFDFTITISNPEDEDLSGLVFSDVLPAEFDVSSVDVDNTNAPVGGGCAASSAEHTNQGKSGKAKLQPDIVTFVADLADDESCDILVTAVTDDDHPGGGQSPTWTPTSCPSSGMIVLNEGVEVFEDVDMSGTVSKGDVRLFQDDDSLELTCVGP